MGSLKELISIFALIMETSMSCCNNYTLGLDSTIETDADRKLHYKHDETNLPKTLVFNRAYDTHGKTTTLTYCT